MIKYPVCFRSSKEIEEFVNLTNLFDCDIDIVSGNRMVDAKSLMGVIAISEAADIHVVIHTDQDSDVSDTLLSKLEKFTRTKESDEFIA